MKKGLFIVVSLLILLAIPISVFLVKQNQDTRQKAAPATTLAFSPSSVTKNVNDEFTLNATVDTAQNSILVAEIHVTYDPQYLEAKSITNGAAFPTILNAGVVGANASGGKSEALITVGVTNSAAPYQGTGTAITVRFKALKATTRPTSITFSNNTFLGSTSEGATNVLIGSTPATVTITGGTPATSATTLTPTPIPTQSVLSTSSPSLTPTVSLSTSTATPSAVTITSPTNNAAVTGIPVFTGKGPPNSSVTLTIYSDPITTVVTTDASGNWTYTPTTPLDPGPHSIVASGTSVSGVTETATTAFVVPGGAGGESSTLSAVPTSGSVSTTIIISTLGILCIVLGISLPLVLQ
jgi:hypothetical protein